MNVLISRQQYAEISEAIIHKMFWLYEIILRCEYFDKRENRNLFGIFWGFSKWMGFKHLEKRAERKKLNIASNEPRQFSYKLSHFSAL